MNVQTKINEDTASEIVVCRDCAGLAAIRQPGCAAVIWDRPLRPGFLSWIHTLQTSQLPRARFVVGPTEVRQMLAGICAESGMPEGEDRAHFIDDISTLADAFARLLNAPFVRVRLDVIANDACRKFHVDSVMARLICTYRGTGTQYGTSADETEPKDIATVPTGNPILLRGTQWPGDKRSGVLHRSPPIAGTKETRLVLVLDPMQKPEEV